MHSTHLLMKGVKDTMDLANFFNPFQVRKKTYEEKKNQNLNDILKPFPVGCWHSLEALHGPDGTLSNSYIFIFLQYL